MVLVLSMIQILLFPILPACIRFLCDGNDLPVSLKNNYTIFTCATPFDQAKEMAKGDLKLLQHRFRSLVRGCEAVYRERLKAEKEYEEDVGR